MKKMLGRGCSWSVLLMVEFDEDEVPVRLEADVLLDEEEAMKNSIQLVLKQFLADREDIRSR